jgi:hypothetical protein
MALDSHGGLSDLELVVDALDHRGASPLVVQDAHEDEVPQNHRTRPGLTP